MIISFLYLNSQGVESSGNKRRNVKETNQCPQDYSSDIIKVMIEWKQSSVGADGYDKGEHFVHNYSCVFFCLSSLLLIELSERE
jgi:hypothetical protein